MLLTNQNPIHTLAHAPDTRCCWWACWPRRQAAPTVQWRCTWGWCSSTAALPTVSGHWWYLCTTAICHYPMASHTLNHYSLIHSDSDTVCFTSCRAIYSDRLSAYNIHTYIHTYTHNMNTLWTSSGNVTKMEANKWSSATRRTRNTYNRTFPNREQVIS